ncbi:hypothetical protein OSL54_19325, partial [Escherichia coli]|nr:hypothetical protein [Escherichia coli]
SAQIREILISESAWEEMTCLFAPSLTYPLISYPHPDVHGWCNMFEKIGVYGVVLTAHVVLNGAKKTYTLKMWVIILKESHI